MEGRCMRKILVLGSCWMFGFSAVAQIENDPDYNMPFDETPAPPANSNNLPNFSETPGRFGDRSSPPLRSSGGPSSSEALLSNKKRQQMAKAGIEDITDVNFNETIESFDFPNAAIGDVVKAISELTGKNFIIDSGVSGKITIIAPTRITVAEAYKAFLSSLAINNLAVVPSGGFYKIRPVKAAMKDGVETYAGSYYPSADQLITRIFHLKHISADTVNKDLSQFLRSGNGEVSIYSGTNSLIVSDYGSNIDRIQRIINALDVPGFDEQLEVMPVKFAKAKDIAELVNKIVNKGDTRNQPGGGFAAGMPRGAISSRGSQGGAFFMVIPDDRTNALIVSGNKAGIDRIRQLLKRLDFRMSPEDAGGFYVYTVKHGDAKKIATTLQGVIKDSSPRPGSSQAQPFISPITGLQQPMQEIFGSEVKVQADEATNALVIVASKQDYDTMQSLLAQLDRPRDQVFVEAIIMEMQASDAFSWQIGGFQFQGSNGVKAGFNTLDPSTLGELLTPTGGSGAIIPFGTGNPLEITQLNGTKVTLPSTLGFVNFLKKNANANVLSTPQILALDNQEASIEVGDKVVIGSSLQTTQYGSTETPQFEDATISLKITPSISSSIESVRLQIDGSVKQISTAATPSAFQSKTQPLATRKIKTSIVVPNQATAVLGGLMKDDQIEKVSKVPLLGDIPILGWLFKSRATQTVKTNLVVLLTPKIVKTDQDQKELLGRTLNERLDYVKKTGGLDPYGKKIDQVSRGEVFGPLKSSAAGVQPKSEVDVPYQEKKSSSDSSEEPPMESLDSVNQ